MEVRVRVRVRVGVRGNDAKCPLAACKPSWAPDALHAQNG